MQECKKELETKEQIKNLLFELNNKYECLPTSYFIEYFKDVFITKIKKIIE